MLRERRRAIPALAALILGAAVVIIPDTFHILRTAGIFHVAAYHHWMPGFTGFHWSQPWHPPLNTTDTPQGLLMLRDIFGLTSGLTRAPFVATVAALGGVLLLTFPARLRNLRWAGLTLALFAIGSLTAHAFYEQHAHRFHVLSFPALLISGAAGWDLALRRLGARSGRHALVAAALAALVAAALIGPNPPPVDPVKMTANWELQDLFAHRSHREEVRRIDAPLFVHRLPLLNARLLLGLSDSPHPIASLTPVLEIWVDGHLPQFLWYEVRPPRGHLISQDIWPHDPLNSHLISREGEITGGDFAEQLMTRCGRIAVYFPAWSEAEVQPLLTWASDRGLMVENHSHSERWRLLTLQRPATPGTREESNR